MYAYNTILFISDTLGACSRSLYALRVLRAHGLPPAALQVGQPLTSLVGLWSLCKAKGQEQT